MKTNAVRRPDLAAGLTEYRGSQGRNWMGLDILPVRRVDRKADTFHKALLTEKALTSTVAARAVKGSYGRLNYRTTTDSWACLDMGLEDLVDDVQVADVQVQFDAEQDCANGVMVNVQRAQEIRIATLAFNATTFSSYTGNVTTEWSTAATATPFKDVNDAAQTLLGNVGGVLPAQVELCLAVSAKVFLNMQNTAEIKALRGGGAGGRRKVDDLPPMTEAEMAAILGIDQVFRSRAKNGSSDVWDDEYALLFLRHTGQDLSVPQLGRTFLWTEDSPDDYIVETYRGEDRRSTVVRVRQNVDEEILNASCAYLLANITA